MEYSFKASNDLKKMPLTGKLMNIVDFSPGYSEAVAKLHGQLLAVFGEAAYTTKSLENVYCYIIIATGEDGSEHILSLYEGPSGPAIGGENSADDAAKALIKHIKSVQPMDYEYEGYYFDGPTKVHRGIKNGEVFYSEVEMSLEEFDQAYKEVYPDH